MIKPCWYKIQPLHQCKPSQRWGHSSCVIGDELIIFGGYADSNYMNDLWSFNTRNLQWKLINAHGNIPQVRSNATLNYHKQSNRIIMFGGGGQNKKRFNSIYEFDWNSKEWAQIFPLSQDILWERTYHITQIIGHFLVVFGGENFSDLNDLWLFDMKQLTWKEIHMASAQIKPCSRRFHASVVRKNQLIIIGGCHNKYRSLKDTFSMNFNQFLKTNKQQSLVWKEIQFQNSDFIPRWGHSATYNQLNDKIYIFGGRFSTDLRDIVCLDLQNSISKKIAVITDDQMPCQRRRHCAKFIGSTLLVFGGFNGSYYNDLYGISFSPHYQFLKNIKRKKDTLNQIVLLQNKQFQQHINIFKKAFIIKNYELLKVQDKLLAKDKNKNKNQFKITQKMRQRNQVLKNIFQNDKLLQFPRCSAQTYLVFLVGLTYLQTNNLVLPSQFSQKQFLILVQFADYFCMNDLLTLLQRYFLSKVSNENIFFLSQIASKFQMQSLMNKCSILIIEKEQIKFFAQKYKIKVTPQAFFEFQRYFFSNQKNFLYPIKFQKEITHQFETNKLNILLRNIYRSKDKKSFQKISVFGYQNQIQDQKQNQENLFDL